MLTLPAPNPFFHPPGNKYDGEWVDDVKEGYGVLTYVNGERYEGYWKNDKAHGKGTLTYSQGDRYIGDWAAGKKHGTGELHYANNDVFRGEWADDHATGRGILQYSIGNIYEGAWLMDRRHGHGSFTCAQDGYRYEGEWYQGRRHGQGSIYLTNGDSFTGMWKEGKMEGPVMYRCAAGPRRRRARAQALTFLPPRPLLPLPSLFCQVRGGLPVGQPRPLKRQREPSTAAPLERPAATGSGGMPQNQNNVKRSAPHPRRSRTPSAKSKNRVRPELRSNKNFLRRNN